jgi:hypothetical protein
MEYSMKPNKASKELSKTYVKKKWKTLLIN